MGSKGRTSPKRCRGFGKSRCVRICLPVTFNAQCAKLGYGIRQTMLAASQHHQAAHDAILSCFDKSICQNIGNAMKVPCQVSGGI